MYKEKKANLRLCLMILFPKWSVILVSKYSDQIMNLGRHELRIKKMEELIKSKCIDHPMNIGFLKNF